MLAPRLLKRLLMLLPSSVAPPAIASAMKMINMAYSVAVAPRSSLQKRQASRGMCGSLLRIFGPAPDVAFRPQKEPDRLYCARFRLQVLPCIHRKKQFLRVSLDRRKGKGDSPS